MELLDDHLTIQALTGKLFSEYEVDEQESRASVTRLIRALSQSEVIEIEAA